MGRVRVLMKNILCQLSLGALLVGGQAQASVFNPHEQNCDPYDAWGFSTCVLKNGHYYIGECVKYRMAPLAGYSDTDWWFRTQIGGCNGFQCEYGIFTSDVEAVGETAKLDGSHICFKTEAEALADLPHIPAPDLNVNLVELSPVAGVLPFAEEITRFCEPFAGVFSLEVIDVDTGTSSYVTRSSQERCYEKAGAFKIDISKLGTRSYTPPRTRTEGPFSVSEHIFSASHPLLIQVNEGNSPAEGTQHEIDGLQVTIGAYGDNDNFGVMKDDGSGLTHSLAGWGGGFRVVALTVTTPGRLRVWGTYINGDPSVWNPTAGKAWEAETGMGFVPHTYPAPVKAYPVAEERSGAEEIDVAAGDTIYLWAQYFAGDWKHGFYVTLSDGLDNEIASLFIKQRHLPSSWQLGFDSAN